jgi:hypothetical protein
MTKTEIKLKQLIDVCIMMQESTGFCQDTQTHNVSKSIWQQFSRQLKEAKKND